MPVFKRYACKHLTSIYEVPATRLTPLMPSGERDKVPVTSELEFQNKQKNKRVQDASRVRKVKV